MAIPSKFTRGRPAGNSRGKNNTPWVLRSGLEPRLRTDQNSWVDLGHYIWFHKRVTEVEICLGLQPRPRLNVGLTTSFEYNISAGF